ncbi:Rossmann-like domain-containing protein [Acetobacterium carbinolicum]|uniref:Rossmann-like domain-containing protein n=1 Tax=Acetobacterium carbinolicum TaxID=52690 RepID=UPI0039C914F4
MLEEKNIIIAETIEQIEQTLGSELDQITVDRAVFGLFFSGVKLSTGHGGLCFTPVKEMPEAVCCPSTAKAMPLSGKLVGRPVLNYIEDVHSKNPLKKTLGIATLNALSTLCWEKEKPDELTYEISMGEDAFEKVDVSQYQKTVVIGALVPMLKKLTQAGADYKVLEMDSRTLKGKELEHYAPATDAHLYIPDADLIVITGVTILNNTLYDLLKMAKKGAEIIVTGPTASMLPDVFFKYGVTLLGGIVVTKADEILDIISEGGSGYHFFGKYAERTAVRAVCN